jgi:hypothetical protein
MAKKIINWLNRPYPVIISDNSKFKLSLSFGVFVFFFLMIFRPFDYNQLNFDEMLYYSYLYAVITIITLLFNFFILPIFLESIFNPSNWKIYKEILFEFQIVLTIGFLNWFFSFYSTHFVKNSEYNVLFFIETAFLVGFFPIIISIFITERKVYSKRNKIAESISTVSKLANSNQDNPDNSITIKGDNKKEFLTLNKKQLLYISSEKNYASVFYLNDNKIKEELIRTSLTKIENQLKDNRSIIRCHKSYIVNSIHVEKIIGNARNYSLKIHDTDILIPVSRKFPRELLFTLLKK